MAEIKYNTQYQSSLNSYNEQQQKLDYISQKWSEEKKQLDDLKQRKLKLIEQRDELKRQNSQNSLNSQPTYDQENSKEIQEIIQIISIIEKNNSKLREEIISLNQDIELQKNQQKPIQIQPIAQIEQIQEHSQDQLEIDRQCQEIKGQNTILREQLLTFQLLLQQINQ